jgi:NADH-quinone oxidoreductase subunit M
MRVALLGSVWLFPLLVAGLVRIFAPRRAAARWLGISVAALLVPIAVVIFVSSETELLTAAPVRALAMAGLAVDGLSAVLLPLVACLSLAVIVAMPRGDIDSAAVASLLVVEGATLGVLVSANLLLLGTFWGLALLPLLAEARRSRDTVLLRASRWAFALCVVPMFVVIATVVVLAVVGHVVAPLDMHTIIESRVARPRARLLAPILLIACTARMGIVPFHLWMPAALERGRLAVMLPAVVSPIGSYALVRVALGIFPFATREWCGSMTVFATISGVYGAVLALGQNNARRQLGYLWTSVGGFVLAGVSTLDGEGLSGALIHDVSLVIAVTGLALIVGGVEARAGTADFRRLGSIVVRAPRMATGYFLLGAAAVGFPATVTFVSEDLVVQGLVRTRPSIAVILLASLAVNAITLFRSFKRIFLGSPSSLGCAHSVSFEDLLPRERWVSVVLILALIAGGFVPTPLLAIRRHVETGILAPGERAPSATPPSR